jgi:hypothetical protein
MLISNEKKMSLALLKMIKAIWHHGVLLGGDGMGIGGNG